MGQSRTVRKGDEIARRRSSGYDPRRSPYFRRCPVHGCSRGYMINYHKGCIDHRNQGIRMWAEGTHPERRRTQPPPIPPSASRPSQQSPPQPTSASRPSKPSTRPSQRTGPKVPAIVWIIVGIIIWGFVSNSLGSQEPGTDDAPRIEADSQDFDLPDYSPRSGACGAGSYRNVDGDCISGPVHAPSAPPGATARCRDGTYSFSRNRSGTCSHHGGVASWDP